MKLSSFVDFDPVVAEEDAGTLPPKPDSPPIGPARKAMMFEVCVLTTQVGYLGASLTPRRL